MPEQRQSVGVRDVIGEELLFSIIIPTFNRANLVYKTLDSVASQTYRPIEIVIVDDGSSDDTREQVATWIKSIASELDVSVQYFWQENMGPAVARNRGIVESSGEYIMFLDSDDLLYPDCLEKFSVMFQNNRADMVIAGCDEIQSGKVVDSYLGISSNKQFEMLALGQIVLMTIRIALTRQVVNKTGHWNVHMKTGEDREFFQRALFLANNPMGVRESLAGFTRGLMDHRSQGYDQSCRIKCEEDLLTQVLHRKDIGLHVVNFVISRVARIGCKMNAMGYRDLALRCANAVSNCSCPLSFKVRVQIFLCRSGEPGAWIYKRLSWLEGRN